MFQSTLQQVANTHQEQTRTDEYASRPHMCDTCGKRFTLLENLNRHQMIHTDERPYLCHFCQKRFRLAQHLKEHIRIHTGEKPYKCNECGRAFCQISNLKSHQKTHTKIKAFRCDICGKSFRRSFTLKQHRLTHTRNKVDVLKSAPPLLKKDDVNHEKLSRKRSAPANLGTYYSDRKMSQNFYPSESSNGLAILSAIGAQMSRFSPNNSMNVQSNVSAYQPPQTAPLLSNNDKEKERYVFPSLTALLSHEDTQSSSSTPMQYNTALHSLSSESFNFYTQRYGNFLAQNIQSNAHPIEAAERYCCNECNQTFDKEIDLHGHVAREHTKRLRRDSAYSSHDDKSLPNSPENKNNNFTVENAQRIIKQESHCSDDDVIKSDCDVVKEKSTKSGAKWKQQLCRGWLSHEEECRHHTSNEEKQNEPEICDISPAPLMIDSNEDAPITDKRNEVPSNQQPAQPTENQSNVPSLIPAHGPPPLCFGMERMIPVIEWKPVVTGWKDAMTGYVYPMPSTQAPSKYQVSSDTSTSSSAGQPYFNFSPNVLRAYGMTAYQQQPEDVARANANVQSVLTPPSEENLEKYNNMFRQGLLQNWDPNRIRLFGTSTTPAEPNLLIAQ